MLQSISLFYTLLYYIMLKCSTYLLRINTLHCTVRYSNVTVSDYTLLKELLALPPNERDLAVFKKSLDDYDNFVSVDNDENIMDPLE